jgi:hypothetical protein
MSSLILFVIVAVGILLIFRAAMRANQGGSILSSTPNVVTQIGDDGFWITSCPAEPSSIIHYAYWSGGVRHTGHIPFQPDSSGRQFVYTGARPEQVSITRIVEDSDDIVPGVIPPIVGTTSTFWGSSSSAPSPPSSSAFPSAY